MKHLKITKFLLVISALTFGISQLGYTQNQSDFQIKSNFEQDIENIYQSLIEVESSEEAEELVQEARQVQGQYSDHEDFLDVLLYPETFESRISYLNELTESTRDHIVRIEEGTQRGDDLDELVSNMSDTLSQRRDEIEQLSSELSQTQRARDNSAAQVRNLRAQLRERDELILDIADSLFVAYESLDLPSLTAGEREELVLEIDSDNVFGHLESVIQNNMAFLDTHTQLSSEDFLRLYATQHEFKEVFDNLGPQLSQIYVGQAERQERVDQISGMINEWEMQVDDAVWQSLNATFEERGIELQSFNDGISFYTSLNGYLDNSIARAQESADEDELARYEQFETVWQEDVKRRWQDPIITANLMTYDNFATIDSKLSTWGLVSQPQSYTMLIFLGIAVLIIIALLVLWLKAKSAPAAANGQAPPQARPRPPRPQAQAQPAAPVMTQAPRQSQPKGKKKLTFPEPPNDPEAEAKRKARRSKSKY
ncbi:MAG: hypothetical protein WD491_05875 [Balneolales bacterium]